MTRITFTLLAACLILTTCKPEAKPESEQLEKTITAEKKQNKSLEIIPIKHATAILKYDDICIYLDPTGGLEAFEKHQKPNYIVITDIHGDHMHLPTLTALDLSSAQILAPKAVIEKLPEALKTKALLINNGDIKTLEQFSIEAIPMYNLREEALKFHAKGRGNGYVFSFGETKVYFSGDTEDIPEMRQLKNIDKAFVCMNLPYTMTVESAASAVLEFKPKQVYPYHYRGTDGLSDIEQFKKLINAGNQAIEVVQWDWYN